MDKLPFHPMGQMQNSGWPEITTCISVKLGFFISDNMQGCATKGLLHIHILDPLNYPMFNLLIKQQILLQIAYSIGQRNLCLRTVLQPCSSTPIATDSATSKSNA